MSKSRTWWRILAANVEAERPAGAARLVPRAHTVLHRPRRITTSVSRPAPAIVRAHESTLHQ